MPPRRLPFLITKAKIENSVQIGVRDEEVEAHGKSDCGHFGEGNAGLPSTSTCLIETVDAPAMMGKRLSGL